MSTRFLLRLAAPALALTGAALLLGPAHGYTLLGGELNLTQRDFRVHNNFTDPTANDNLAPDAQFPGHQGAVMAIWKACVEWGSELHGNGQGDPWQPGGIGSGGANFDPAFAGEATGVGGTNDNIHSEIGGSQPGVYAFAESPISDGWRIRYYEEWIWSDGPGVPIGAQKDLQGVACHEYGHALGLDHSGVIGATMQPGTFSGIEQRNILGDDQNGVRAIYGVKSASKPHITSVGISGTTATIIGSDFDLNDNEVWFTPLLASAPSADPLIKVTGVASTGGAIITVAVPTLAGKGDILVKVPGGGHDRLSNAFPFNGEGVGPTAPSISGISPNSIPAINVGSAQILTVTGTHFTPDVAVSVDGVALFGIPSPVTYVDANTLTVDPPLPVALGTSTLTVSNGFGSDSEQFTYTANPTPALQVGDGDEPVTFISSVDVVVGGTPGALFYVGFSLDKIPSVLPGVVSLDIGNNFTSIFQVGAPLVVGPAGHTTFNLPGGTLPPLTTFFLQGITFEPLPSFPLPNSNLQEVQFLF